MASEIHISNQRHTKNNYNFFRCLSAVGAFVILIIFLNGGLLRGQATTTNTISDGSETSTYIPMYGSWFDAYTKSEFIYPAALLTEIPIGSTITSMTFYISSFTARTNGWNNTSQQVFLKEVGDTTSLNGSYRGTARATVVYNRQLTLPSGTGAYTITFDQTYTYNGNNLLIGIYNTAPGIWNSVTWYGTTGNTTGCSAYGYSSSNLSAATYNQMNFLPKVSFGYIPPASSCPPPSGLTISSITSNSATVSWTAGGTESSWTLEYGSNSDFSDATIVNVSGSPTTNITNLTGNTTYYVRVKANCGGGDESFWCFTNFKTVWGVPSCEDFASSYTPSGWSRYQGLLTDVMNGTPLSNNDYYWYVGYPNGAFPGNNHAYLNIFGKNRKDWLVTPQTTLSGDVLLEFDLSLTACSGTLQAPATTGTDDKFVVLISTNNMATWTILRQWDNTGASSSDVYNNISHTAEGDHISIDLSAYSEQTVYVAFYGESTVSNADNYLHIDNVCFNPSSYTAPVCFGFTSETYSNTNPSVDSGIPTYWSRIFSGSGPGYAPHAYHGDNFSCDNGHGNKRGILMAANDGVAGNTSIVILPRITSLTAGSQITFKYRFNQTTYGNLRLGYMEESTFHQLRDPFARKSDCTDTIYTLTAAQATEIENNNRRLAFELYNNNNSMAFVFIDTICISTPPCTHATKTCGASTIKVGECSTYSVSGEGLDGDQVHWSASPAGVVQLDGTTGLSVVATAVGVGNVTITAHIDATNGFCEEDVSCNVVVGDGCAQVGNEISTNYTFPIYTYNSYYSYTQQIYSATDINNAGGCRGKINSVKFRYAESSALTIPIEIYLGRTNQSSLASAWITDANLTKVYTSPAGGTTFSSEWVEITLDTPYDWDGTSNILVAIKTTGTPSNTLQGFRYTSITGGGRVCTNPSDTVALNGAHVPSASGTPYGYRPNIKFCIDCCSQERTGTFEFADATHTLLAGGGSYTNQLTNELTPSGPATFSISPSGVSGVHFNTSTGEVSAENGVEGEFTITATVEKDGDVCDKSTSYTLFIGDGCAQVGTPTTATWNNMLPIYTSGGSKFSYSQMLYMADEIRAAGGCTGKINGLKFKLTSATSFTVPINIYIGATDKAYIPNNPDAWITGVNLTQVFSGDVYFSTGWVNIPITSYTWDGTSNLLIVFHTTGVAPTANATFEFTQHMYPYMAGYSQGIEIIPIDDNIVATTTCNPASCRPNIKFCIDCCTPRTGNIDFCKNMLQLTEGDVVNMSVEGFGGVSPTPTDSPAITYNSSDTLVATVTNDGTVTGRSNGMSTITATIAQNDPDGYCPVVASYPVIVGVSGGGNRCAQIGDGTTYTGVSSGTYGGVHSSLSRFAYTQQIYTAEELHAGGACAGKVTKILIHYYEPTDNEFTFDLYIGQSNTSLVTTSWITDANLTRVYSGTYTFTQSLPVVEGWNVIDISSANWSWDGTSNIILAFHRTTRTTPSGTYWPNFYYVDSPLMTIYGESLSSISLGANKVPLESTEYEFPGHPQPTNQRPEVRICTDCNYVPDIPPTIDVTNATQESICTGNPVTGMVVTASNDVTFDPALNTLELSYNTSTHTISGTPNFTGPRTVTVTTTSSDGCLKAEKELRLTVVQCCTPRDGVLDFCKDEVNITTGTADFTIPLTNTVNPSGTINYTCDPAGVVTVNSTTGLVHPVAPGTATITATIPAETINGTDYCSKSTSYTVNVGTECTQIGDGTIHTSRPEFPQYGQGIQGGIYTEFSSYAYTQQVYTAAELTSDGSACPGKIKSIVMHYWDGLGRSNNLSFELYIGQSTATQASTTWIHDANLKLFYSGTYTFTPDNDGWNEITKSAGGMDFDWDGTSNIVLAFRRTNNEYPTTHFPDFYHTNTANMTAYKKNGSSINLDANNVTTDGNGTLTSQRPEIRICTSCSITPTPFPSATLNPITQTVCKTGDVADAINDIVVTAVVPVGGSVTLTPSDKGLSYDSGAGKITGTPNFTGNQEFTLTVKDAEDCLKDEKSFTVTVNSLNATIEFGD